MAHGTAWSAPAVSSLMLKQPRGRRGLRDRRGTHRRRDHRARLLRRRGAARHRAGGHLRQPRRRGGAVRADRRRARVRLRHGSTAHRSSSKTSHSETVLVYDLGGGTFDATVIELADRRISVLAVEGDHQLGGADWDERIALHLSRRFCAEQPRRRGPARRLRRRPRPSCWPPNGPSSSSPTPSAPRWSYARRRPRHRAALPGRAGGDDGAAAAPHARPDPLLPRRGRPPRGGARSTGCCWSADRRGCPPWPSRCAASFDLDPQLHDPELAVARGAAIYGEKKELERMVAADLRSRGRLRDGAPLDDALPADLDARLPPGGRRVRRAAAAGAPRRGDPRRHGRVPRLRRARGERRSSAGSR